VGETTSWKCDVCGYIHQGDLPPGSCPICGVGPDMFSPFSIAPAKPQTSKAWRCTICDYIHEGDSPPERCPLCGAGSDMFEPYEREVVAAVQSDVRRLVIVGAGIAGVTAAENARSSSPEVGIQLVSSEPGLPYYRLNLTRLLAGEVGEQSMAIHDRLWYSEANIELVQGQVLTIDREEKSVKLLNGPTLSYDRLVLASGSHAFVPPIPGSEKGGVHTLRTLDDTRDILKCAAASRRCVVIGGGLLGLETAGALHRQGMDVVIVERFGRLLPRQLAEPAAEMLRSHLEGLGIAVRAGVNTEAILGGDTVQAVRLVGGDELAADLVVISAGVRPNSYLARQAKIEVDRGVLVDDRLATSDPDIFAAGDLAEHRGIVYGIWPTAYAQGVVAGANAVGGAMSFEGLPFSNRLKVLDDVDVYSVGQFEPTDGSYRVVERQAKGTYIRLVCHDGKLVGANLYGDTTMANMVAEAIEKGTSLGAMPHFTEKYPELLQQ
jgi:nitrite reductase (NADH) large subunit